MKRKSDRSWAQTHLHLLSQTKSLISIFRVFSPVATATHPSRQSHSHPPATHSPKPVSSLHPLPLQSRSHGHPPTQSPVPQPRLSLTAIASWIYSSRGDFSTLGFS
uniref:Uncharacterized protein n=1 Tax=Manihot esculenta TaxID=3983 RepID=A0A2C9WI34_MANES